MTRTSVTEAAQLHTAASAEGGKTVPAALASPGMLNPSVVSVDGTGPDLVRLPTQPSARSPVPLPRPRVQCPRSLLHGAERA
jgi:hypothetical protein